MRFWSFYLFAVSAVAFSSNAAAQRASWAPVQPFAQSLVTYVTNADSSDDAVDEEIEVEGVSYDLRLDEHAPIPDSAHEGFDIIEFTVTNAGNDPSPQTRLLVNTVTTSVETHVRELHQAGDSVIPPLRPHERVTVRVQVPRLSSRDACYMGKILLPDDAVEKSPLS